MIYLFVMYDGSTFYNIMLVTLAVVVIIFTSVH